MTCKQARRIISQHRAEDETLRTAVRMWRDEDTGREFVIPTTKELVFFIMRKLKRSKQCLRSPCRYSRWGDKVPENVIQLWEKELR
jgi:hypothetical protein